MAADDLAVVCRDLTKDFGTGDGVVHALQGVTLEVAYGQITMLVGPSGCGKTTLLCVIAGLLNSTSGQVSILGQQASLLSERERVGFRRQHLGFVFQQFNLLPALTAAENVAVPLFAAGVARREAIERGATLLAELGMGDRVRALPRELSGGQQQRVALARAVIHEPRLVVCDEPTSALDAGTGHHVMELLSRVSLRADRAVIVVTHDSRIFEFADTIAHMDDGRVQNVERTPNGFAVTAAAH